MKFYAGSWFEWSNMLCRTQQGGKNLSLVLLPSLIANRVLVYIVLKRLIITCTCLPLIILFHFKGRWKRERFWDIKLKTLWVWLLWKKKSSQITARPLSKCSYKLEKDMQSQVCTHVWYKCLCYRGWDHMVFVIFSIIVHLVLEGCHNKK